MIRAARVASTRPAHESLLSSAPVDGLWPEHDFVPPLEDPLAFSTAITEIPDDRGGIMSNSAAVELARAHLEAWTNHDLESARNNLAEGVEFHSPAGAFVGVDEYMDAPRGLTQFARMVVPGSLRVIAEAGDDRNALMMYEVTTDGGPGGPKVFVSAQTWLLDGNGKIKVERLISYATPRAG